MDFVSQATTIELRKFFEKIFLAEHCIQIQVRWLL